MGVADTAVHVQSLRRQVEPPEGSCCVGGSDLSGDCESAAKSTCKLSTVHLNERNSELGVNPDDFVHDLRCCGGGPFFPLKLTFGPFSCPSFPPFSLPL